MEGWKFERQVQIAMESRRRSAWLTYWFPACRRDQILRLIAAKPLH